MRLALGVGIALVAALAAGACGDDETTAATTGTTTSSSDGGAGGSDDDTPPNSCIQPGDVGNDKGVGQYCTPGGMECTAFPEAPLCLADAAQDQWFCTRIGCDETTDCGEEAGCLITGAGSACVPCMCDDSGIGCTPGGGGVGGEGGAGGSSGGGAGGR